MPHAGQAVPGAQSADRGSREGAPPTNLQTGDAVELVFQTGHVGAIYQVATSSDGRYILTSDNAVIKLWDVGSHVEVRSFPAYGYRAGGRGPLVDFSADNHQMLLRDPSRTSFTTAPSDRSGSAELIDLGTGRTIVRTTVLSADGRFGVEDSSPKAAKVAYSGDLTLTDLRSGEQTKLQAAYPIAFSQGAKYLLTGKFPRFEPGKIDLVVWDVPTRRKVQTILIDASLVPTTLISEHADQLVSMPWDGSIDTYSLQSGQMRHVAPADTADRTLAALSAPHSLTLSPSGREVARIGPQGQIDIFDLESGQKVLALSLASDDATSLPDNLLQSWSSFSADGRWFAAGRRAIIKPYDASLSVWEIKSGRPVLHSQASSIAFSADGQTAVLGLQGVPILHNLVTGKEDGFGSGIQSLTSVDVTVDSRFAVTNTLTGVRVWDLATAHLNANIACPDGMRIRSARPSPTQNVLVVVCADGSVRLLNPASGDLIEQLDLHMTPLEDSRNSLMARALRAICFSRDGGLLALVDKKRIVVWDLAAHHLVGQVDTSSEPSHVADVFPFKGGDLEPAYMIRTLAVDEKAQALAVARYGEVLFWDFRTSKLIRRFNDVPMAMGRDIAFGADGRQLSAGLGICLDLETGERTLLDADILSPDGSVRARFSKDSISLRPATTGVSDEATLVNGRISEIRSVVFTPDSRQLLSIGRDGALRVWSVSERRELAALYALGEADSLAVTPDNYYLASRAGLRGISFRLHGEQYPFEQFDLRFDRPDFVLQRLSRASAQDVQGYRVAYERRMKKLGLTEQMLRGDFHLPEVRVLTPVSAETRQTSLALQVEASDEQQLLDRFNVYVNDVPVFGSAGLSASGRTLHRDQRQILVPVIPGTNKIQVSVLNQEGVESLRQTLYVVSTAPADPVDVYIVGVGVSHYRNAKYDLHYAAKDAIDLMRLYKNAMDAGGANGTVHLLDLTDERATRAQIGRAREWLAQSHPNDLVIVFAAGHGMTDVQQNYYFGTYDIDSDRPQVDGLPYDELEGLLDGIPALKKLLLVDTCFSGEIDKDEVVAVAGPTPSSDGTVKRRTFKESAGVGSAQAATRRAKHYQDVFVDLRRGTGALVISSASADEYALEGGQWHNGVFTYALLSGLKGEADANKDGMITADELQTYVLAKVRQLTGGMQNPTIRRDNLDFDFPIYGRLATVQ